MEMPVLGCNSRVVANIIRLRLGHAEDFGKHLHSVRLEGYSALGSALRAASPPGARRRTSITHHLHQRANLLVRLVLWPHAAENLLVFEEHNVDEPGGLEARLKRFALDGRLADRGHALGDELEEVIDGVVVGKRAVVGAHVGRALGELDVGAGLERSTGCVRTDGRARGSAGGPYLKISDISLGQSWMPWAMLRPLMKSKLFWEESEMAPRWPWTRGLPLHTPTGIQRRRR